jgi:ArsR family transcriptional regulator
VFIVYRRYTMNTLIEPHLTFKSCEPAEIAAKLSALSHPARIEILQYLAGVEAGCCKEVVQRFDLAQSTVSQHLKVLVDAGLVRFTADRPRSRYEVDRKALDALAHAVSGLFVSCCAPPVAPHTD